MCRILLSDHGTIPWFTDNGVYVRGWFHSGDEYYDGATALSYLSARWREEQDFEKIIGSLNGNFSLIRGH